MLKKGESYFVLFTKGHGPLINVAAMPIYICSKSSYQESRKFFGCILPKHREWDVSQMCSNDDL